MMTALALAYENFAFDQQCTVVTDLVECQGLRRIRRQSADCRLDGLVYEFNGYLSRLGELGFTFNCTNKS